MSVIGFPLVSEWLSTHLNATFWNQFNALRAALLSRPPFLQMAVPLHVFEASTNQREVLRSSLWALILSVLLPIVTVLIWNYMEL